MERRTLLAIALSMLILLLYPYILRKFYPQLRQANAPVTYRKKEISPSTQQQAQDRSQSIVKVPLSEEKEVEFETENYKIVLSNIGGVIKSITLKKYFDSEDKTPIELAKIDEPKEAIFFTPTLDYEIDGGLPFSVEKRSDRIAFTAKTHSGLKIDKEIIFHSDKYFLELEQQLTNLTNQARTLKYKLIGGARIAKLAEKDVSYVEIIRNVICLILKPFVNSNALYSNKLSNKELQTEIETAEFILEPNSSITHKFILYAGPNDHDKIRSLNLRLEDSLHLGLTGNIGKFLLIILKFFYGIVKNWGAAIILLTFLINIVLYPLSLKSLKSIKEMQALQPKIDAIRATYKDNPQKLNREIMELYRKHKINPMGGCLPILLQMPVFFALYKVLMRSIELRGAPFLWIKDLSQPDRLVVFNSRILLFGNELNILPLLMAASMFFQQKISGPKRPKSSATADQYAQQQRMMGIMMPLMFGILFYRLPSGLVLYWLTNTLLTMAEQGIFLKKFVFHVEHTEK